MEATLLSGLEAAGVGDRGTDPGEVDAAIALLDGREYARAEMLARELVRQWPGRGIGWKSLAAALAGQMRWGEALEVYARAEGVCAGDWEFQNNFANALKTTGKLRAAESLYLKSIELKPRALEPQYNLALTLMELGEEQGAELWLRAALRIEPAHAMAHLNLANLLNVQHRLSEAEVHYLHALAKLQSEPKLWNNFGRLLAKVRRFSEAEACYRRAIELDPQYATAMSNLGELMANHGCVEEAAMLLRAAIGCDPEDAAAHSNLLFTLAHKSDVSAEKMFAEHVAFAERFERPLRAQRCELRNTREPERPLRIGFVSADMRDHPVVRYLRPALGRLQVHSDLTLTAYSNSTQRDAETERYRQLFHAWREVAHLSDAALAEQIQADGVDVLIDLSGHTGFNRLRTLARRPAPVQVSWMGYVGTTGMESVDYFVADRWLVPESFEWQFTEKLLRVPATTNFAPVDDAPPATELPALRGRGFTFSSLARMNKLNRGTIGVWAEILHGVPGSRMLLAALPDGSEPAELMRWFGEQGIGRERMAFAHTRSVQDVLQLQSEVDLSLDTFPYNGSTSNNHAAWMGVPTLTLAGNMAAGRMGAALALHLGLEKMVARSREEYVELAAGWAGDLEGLAVLRRELRGRFRESLLMQTDVVTDAFAAQLREAWRRWCAGLPARTM